MTAIAVREASDTLQPFDELLADDAFWEAYRKELAKQVTSILFEPFLAGFVAGSRIKPKEKAVPATDDVPDWISPDDLAKLAEEVIATYVPEFTKNISDTTYNQIRDSVTKARQNGTGVESVLRDIQGLFSRSRAEMIAITETTRLFGLGAQASYRAQGFNAWVWMNVEDPWVCAICDGLAADSETNPFPIDKLFSPGHPRCRCFPSPVIVDVPKPTSDKLSLEERRRLGQGPKTVPWNSAGYEGVSWKDLAQKSGPYELTPAEVRQFTVVKPSVRTGFGASLAGLTKAQQEAVLNAMSWVPPEWRLAKAATITPVGSFRDKATQGSTLFLPSGGTSIRLLDSLIPADMARVMVHEYGHAVQFETKLYITTEQAKSISRYARTNDHEAWAETFAFKVLNPNTLTPSDIDFDVLTRIGKRRLK